MSFCPRRAESSICFILENFISGVILYEETLNQKASNGTPFAELLSKKGILPGIKVDKVGISLLLWAYCCHG